MNFEAYKSEDDGCNCKICCQGRYEKILLEHLNISCTNKNAVLELIKYLNWYYDELEATKTELQYINYRISKGELVYKEEVK